MQAQRYCSAAFIAISQAFDKMWHDNLHKIKSKLPYPFVHRLRSYLTDRMFYVKILNKKSSLYKIKAEVPQGSVLGPFLYSLYTFDIPTHTRTLLATFADHTAILASHRNPLQASQILQHNLNDMQTWLFKWCFRANETKSIHVTFTNRR